MAVAIFFTNGNKSLLATVEYQFENVTAIPASTSTSRGKFLEFLEISWNFW